MFDAMNGVIRTRGRTGTAAFAVLAWSGLLIFKFLVYLNNFGRFNLVYGAFGGVLALMMWIYLSGNIVIFGACSCAAKAGVVTSSA